jgi:hypothetical protein
MLSASHNCLLPLLLLILTQHRTTPSFTQPCMRCTLHGPLHLTSCLYMPGRSDRGALALFFCEKKKWKPSTPIVEVTQLYQVPAAAYTQQHTVYAYYCFHRQTAGAAGTHAPRARMSYIRPACEFRSDAHVCLCQIIGHRRWQWLATKKAVAGIFSDQQAGVVTATLSVSLLCVVAHESCRERVYCTNYKL